LAPKTLNSLYEMELADPLSPMALPKSDPKKKMRKNAPMKYLKPSAYEPEMLGQISALLVMMTTSEHNRDAGMMLHPLNAR